MKSAFPVVRVGNHVKHGLILEDRGLQRFLVLFFIDLSSRRVKIAGIGAQANGLWMSQIGRNQSDPIDGLFVGKRYLIHDRDPLSRQSSWRCSPTSGSSR